MAPEDVEKTLRVVVVAVNDAGRSQATSTPTSVVYPGAPVMADQPIETYPPMPPHAPSVVGVPMAGSVLTALPGMWTGAKPISLAYHWMRCDAWGYNCAPIYDYSGQTQPPTDRTYTPTDRDVGSTIAVQVFASNAWGQGSATSSPPVMIGGLSPQPVFWGVGYPPYPWSAPTITGDPTVGQTLTVDRGGWYGASTFAYQWQRCGWAGYDSCEDIPGAVGDRYVLTDLDAPGLIRVRVTAVGSGGLGQALSWGAWVSGPLTATVPPRVVGLARAGETLTATSGAWTGGAPVVEYRYQWQRCSSAGACEDIPGAKLSSYDVTGTDGGSALRAVVYAHNNIGDGQAASDVTEVVPTGAPRAVEPPVIEGVARTGATLTARTGTWTGEPTTYDYAWERCEAQTITNCTTIAGASQSSYQVDHVDVGNVLRVVITATNAEGQGRAPSAVTATVQSANAAPPEISGKPIDGETLTVSNGTWGETPLAYRYQWERCETFWSWTCTPINGANTSAYTLTPTDVKEQIRASVTAVYGSGSDEARSAPTAAVAALRPSVTAPPVLRGQPVEGRTMVASDGQWKGTPQIRYGYHWERCDASGASCVEIGDTTTASRRLTSADAGKTLRVVVSAANAGGSETAETQLTVPIQRRVTAGTGPVAGLDPLGSAVEEQVVASQQPDPDNETVFDTTRGLFGGPFAHTETGLSPTLALGSGHIYVASGSTRAPSGAGIYSYSDGSGCNTGDGQALGTLCRVAQLGDWAPTGIAFYRGEVFVHVWKPPQDGWSYAGFAPQETRVYDSSLNYKRTLQVGEPDLPLGAYAEGIDAAWGELWIHHDGVGVDWLEVRELTAGALRGIVPIPASTGGADVAISPELDVIGVGAEAVHRSGDLGLLSLDPAALIGSEASGPVCGSGRSGTVGLDAPWGMRWQVAIDNCWSYGRVSEFSLSVDPDTGNVTRTPERSWTPKESYWTGSKTTSRDIAYKPTQPTLHWWGKPTESMWQRGNQQLGYIVSVGDYYLVGNQLEHWWQPATQQSATLKADGQTIWSAGPGPANATPNINQDAIPSGTHTLTLTVTLADGTVLTKTNDAHRIDHDPPTGTLDPAPAATNASVNASGTASDAHSGPKSWTLQYRQTKDRAGNAVSDGWHAACAPSAPSPESGKWTCGWDTAPRAEGTYELQAAVADQVAPADGGANTGTGTSSGNATVIVDRTLPEVENMAPDLYEASNEMVQDLVTPVGWTHSDAASGVRETTVWANTASDGSASGAWEQIGASSAIDDPAFSWDTGGREAGLYRFRARVCDRADNCREREWQAEMLPPTARAESVSAEQADDIRAQRTRCQGSGPDKRCYAGEFVGRLTSAGQMDPYARTWGIGADIRTPVPVPRTGKYDFSSAWVGLGGYFRTNGTVQSGITTNRICGDRERTINGQRHDLYSMRIEYIDPYGQQFLRCFRTVDSGEEHRYTVDVVESTSCAKALVDGTPKFVAVPDHDHKCGRKNKRRYWVNKSGHAQTQTMAEVNDPGRGMGGRFFGIGFQPFETSGWQSPGAANVHAIQDRGYMFRGDPTAFCVSDTERKLCGD